MGNANRHRKELCRTEKNDRREEKNYSPVSSSRYDEKKNIKGSSSLKSASIARGLLPDDDDDDNNGLREEVARTLASYRRSTFGYSTRCRDAPVRCCCLFACRKA